MGMEYEVVSLSIVSRFTLTEYREFEKKCNGPIGERVNIDFVNDLETGDIAFKAHGELLVGRRNDGAWLFCEALDLQKENLLIADADYCQLKILCKSSKKMSEPASRLLRFALWCRMQYCQTIPLHAACVEKDGFAVAFTGQSGLGKSTRAKAWVDALGAEWISGDRPAVRLEKNGSTACGVPWDGKEQIFRNVERPMKAVMEVRRSSCTYLRRLSEEQARKLLMQQSFIPMWDTDAAVMALANVRQFIRKTPVYRVFCGPDGDSAAEIYDILFHHPERIREEAEEMKVKDGFVLRNVVDEFIVMPTGDNIAKFDGAVVLNEVSAFVFEQLKHPVSKEDLLLAMLAEFDVDEETARKDLDDLIEKFQSMDLIEA